MSTVSFCFDDGFAASSSRTAGMFSRAGVHATFAVLASPQASTDDAHRGARFADWGFWREAAAAGHEVAPHGFAHERLDALSPDAACDTFVRCFEVFAREMPGFSPDQSVFHVAYLAAPPAAVRWLRDRVLGVRLRTAGTGRNRVARPVRGEIIDCAACAPPDADGMLRQHLDALDPASDEWLVVVLHGLDGEGWGPVRADTLQACVEGLLDRGVRVAPLGRELTRRLESGVVQT